MKQPFHNFSGIAAAMPAPNINTDAIIPAAYLRTANADLGKGLFGMLRYDDAGNEKPDFVLNQPPFRKAEFLFAGENFGCGSSREAAAWALKQFGMRCVFSPSFADIFYENAFRNGLLAGKVAPDALARMVALAQAGEPAPLFAVDLAAGHVTHAGGERFAFEIAPARRDALLRGDDEIDMTLAHRAEIAAFHSAGLAERPWLHAPLARKA
jgi:3-isopropylmalate dehydratase small subunit